MGGLASQILPPPSKHQTYQILQNCYPKKQKHADTTSNNSQLLVIIQHKGTLSMPYKKINDLIQLQAMLRVLAFSFVSIRKFVPLAQLTSHTKIV